MSLKKGTPEAPEVQKPDAYVVAVEVPTAPKTIYYYPAQPTKDLSKRVRRSKALGIALAVLGFLFVAFGIGAMGATPALVGVLALVVVLVSLILLVLATIFSNEALAKGARALPILITLMAIFLIIGNILGAFASIPEMIPQSPEMQQGGDGNITENGNISA
ncbi:MAG: hypothetical protein AB1665_03085, partial [Candidatus Thermoplasmatota archaeon]